MSSRAAHDTPTLRLHAVHELTPNLPGIDDRPLNKPQLFVDRPNIESQTSVDDVSYRMTPTGVGVNYE